MKTKTIIWVTIFAIAMGFFESAIVIYLRQIVYPDGFSFPLQPIPESLATTEILREAFSLLMLLSVGILTGESTITRFAYFIFSFALWDIFYYIFLKLLINWPESLFTMDILFLLPVTWIGPVITPVIVSGIMILLALLILFFSSVNERVKFGTHELLIFITGSLIIIISFIADYTKFILTHFSLRDLWSIPSEDLFALSLKYYPQNFSWNLFWAGIIVILSGILFFTRRNISHLKTTKIMGT
jgi:hypothetical protein